MVLLYVACLSGFISASPALVLAPQGSIATFPDPSTSSSSPLELLSPSNHSTSWSNKSFTPADPPFLPTNISALQASGLDADKPVSWETTPSGNVIGVQCNTRYGRRLDYLDCRDAYNFMVQSDERVVRFAERHGGWPYDVALPQRVLGSKSSLHPHSFRCHRCYIAQAKIRIADHREQPRANAASAQP